MEREHELYMKLVERRIEMLRLLSSALRQSHKSLAALDLEGIYQGTTQQENLCTGIRFLDRELNAAEQTVSSASGTNSDLSPAGPEPSRLDPASLERLEALRQELALAQAEVRHLNRVQAGLLRRSRRSVNVLVNFFANYSGTYEASGDHAASTLPTTVGA